MHILPVPLLHCDGEKEMRENLAPPGESLMHGTNIFSFIKMSNKERFLGMHRYSVKGGLCGRASVIQTLFILYFIDAIFLAICWLSNYLYEREFGISGYVDHCTFHTVITVLSAISFIPGTFWMYMSMPIQLVKICHIPYFLGSMIGRLYCHGFYYWGLNVFTMIGYYVPAMYKSGALLFLGPSFIKPLHSLFIVWYHLVLEHIRVSGGTGWEMKSVMDLEMEKFGLIGDDEERPTSPEVVVEET